MHTTQTEDICMSTCRKHMLSNHVHVRTVLMRYVFQCLTRVRTMWRKYASHSAAVSIPETIGSVYYQHTGYGWGILICRIETFFVSIENTGSCMAIGFLQDNWNGTAAEQRGSIFHLAPSCSKRH